MIVDMNLFVADCDGCVFGLTNEQGSPLLKRWRVITDCERLAKTLSAARCSHLSDFIHSEISGSTSPKTAAYPVAICEDIAAALYPGTVFGHVPAMPCVQIGTSDNGHWKKDVVPIDFADILLWQPKGLLVALPAEVDDTKKVNDGEGAIVAIGSGAIPELPGEMRWDVKAGKS